MTAVVESVAITFEHLNTDPPNVPFLQFPSPGIPRIAQWLRKRRARFRGTWQQPRQFPLCLCIIMGLIMGISISIIGISIISISIIAGTTILLLLILQLPRVWERFLSLCCQALPLPSSSLAYPTFSSPFHFTLALNVNWFLIGWHHQQWQKKKEKKQKQNFYVCTQSLLAWLNSTESREIE